MERYLLDTHAAIWFFNADGRLSETVSRIMRDLSNPIFLSVVSAWELSIKIGLGKLGFAGKTSGFIRLAETNNITILPIKTTHLTALETLPMLHRDPFDRLLIATALAEEMIIVTADKNIAQYEVSQIW